MPISATRRLMTDSWGIAPIDIRDPSLVLYIPLWYPDSETTGATIISKDTNRRACPVTGAVWSATGRDFDGDDDMIQPPQLWSNDISAFTICMWAYVDPAATGLTNLGGVGLLYTGNYSTDGFQFFWNDSGVANRLQFNAVLSVSGASAIVAGSDNMITTAGWYFLVCKYDKDEAGTTQAVIKVNNTSYTGNKTEAIVQPTGTPRIGKTASNSWDGPIGKIAIWNKKLTDAEDQNFRSMTQWRYQ